MLYIVGGIIGLLLVVALFTYLNNRKGGREEEVKARLRTAAERMPSVKKD